MDPQHHQLKTWPQYFNEVFMGRKNFEVRENDRDFHTGDWVHLNEFDPETKTFTGRKLARRVTYVLHGPGFGIEEGFCVLAIQ